MNENILEGLSFKEAELKVKELIEIGIHEKQIEKIIKKYLSDYNKSVYVKGK